YPIYIAVRTCSKHYITPPTTKKRRLSLTRAPNSNKPSINGGQVSLTLFSPLQLSGRNSTRFSL
ncbi:hypothetical protein BT96DRAFT_923949, partial [Gymnopus androsaceus JB14]